MAKRDRRVIWAPRARRDLLDVWRYYARVASPEIADRLLRDIHQTGNRLSEQALMWRARDDVVPGLRSVVVHPYVLFYRVSETTVEIVRVLHGRRNLPSIFGKRDS